MAAADRAARAVDALAAHVTIHEQARDDYRASTGQKYEPPEAEIQIRGQLMQEVLDSLDVTKGELQSWLMIDKATWDRWRSMKTVPGLPHLETLARFAQEAEQKDSEEREVARPVPFDMLATGARTWGRLRLVYSYYDWNNAVFNFLNPFPDEPTATEMALLALRGCRLVYFMDEPNKWKTDFSQTLVKILGKSYAARALSRFCIISPAANIPFEFGVFNYEARAMRDRVGYRWIWKEEGRPSDSAQPVYEPVLGHDELFLDLREDYGQLIHDALIKINGRSPTAEDFWSPTIDRQLLLEIPVIDRNA